MNLIVNEQWVSGFFAVVPLTTRFVFETWGAVHFARLTLARLIQEGDLDREEDRTNHLTFGSRSEVHLPWSGVASGRSFNVLDFIRNVADARPDAEDPYNFLSEASHPNFLQNAYFQMAEPPISNWDKELFKGLAHNLLTKTLDAYATSTRGMETDVVFMLRDGTNVHHETGEAKIWLEPEIVIAQNYRLNPARLAAALRLLQEHEDEIRAAWQAHFGG